MTEIDKREIFRVMNKYQEMFDISDERVLELVDAGMPYEVMKLLIEPPENCHSCKKNVKGHGQITTKEVPEGLFFEYLCPKCIKKRLDTPTKCTIQQDDKGNWIYKCPHCLLEAPMSDVKFFATHNCVNITMTRDFANSLSKGDKQK